MSEKLRVSLSSFDSKKKELISSVLRSLGNIILEDHLNLNTNLLISASVVSEKFRVNFRN